MKQTTQGDLFGNTGHSQIRKTLESCSKVEELKRVYRQLSKEHHPDLGGDAETMKLVNGVYHACLKRMDGQRSYDNETKREHVYKYDEAKEQAIIEKIFELLALKLSGIEIALMGTWIWITGETKPVKDALKNAGCKWHSKRGCWYWHCDGHRNWYSKRGFASLAAQYGYQEFSNDKVER